MKTTMCWRCNEEYPIAFHYCPDCQAINGNANLEGAQRQMTEYDNDYTDYTMRQGELGNPDRSR